MLKVSPGFLAEYSPLSRVIEFWVLFPVSWWCVFVVHRWCLLIPVRALPFSKDRPSLVLISTEFPLSDLDLDFLFAKMMELRNDRPAVILIVQCFLATLLTFTPCHHTRHAEGSGSCWDPVKTEGNYSVKLSPCHMYCTSLQSPAYYYHNNSKTGESKVLFSLCWSCSYLERFLSELARSVKALFKPFLRSVSVFSLRLHNCQLAAGRWVLRIKKTHTKYPIVFIYQFFFLLDSLC